MKKKFLGIILTLVVMTIIPLAVSAANAPQLQLGSPSYSDLPYDSAAKDKVTATVAVDGTIKLTATAPTSDTHTISDVAYTFNKGGDDCTKFTQNGSTITITGDKPSTGVKIDVTVTWKETPKAGGTAENKSANMTCTVKVVEKAVVDLDITGTQTTVENATDVDKTGIELVDTVTPGYNRFYVGDVFTVTGGTVYYNSGETKPLPPSEITGVRTTTNSTGSKSISLTATDRDITYSYEGADPNSKRSETQAFTKTFGLTVEARKKTLEALEWNPDVKVEDRITVYDAGTNFDYTQIRLRFKEEGTNETKYVYYKVAGASDGFTPVEKSLKMYVGIQTFQISYDNEVYTFNFSTLKITTTAAKTVTAKIISGEKLYYYYGDDFEFDDLELTITEKGLNGDKTYKAYKGDFTPVGVFPASTEQDKPEQIIKDSEGIVSKGITVKYDTKEYDFTWAELGITVTEYDRVLTGLTYKGTPHKIHYSEGLTVTDWGGVDFYALYDNFSAEDFHNLTEKELASKKYAQKWKKLSGDEYANLIVKPFEYSTVYTDINTYAMVAYTEDNLTTDYIKVYGFIVEQKKVESIEVTTPPKKVAYKTEDKIDLTGMKITITYDNGEKDVHSYADDFFTCTPAHGEVVASDTRKIAVVYNDGKVTKSTEFVGISVDNTAKIKSAVVSKQPTKTEYEVGERLSLSGMEVTLVFGDKNTPDYTVKNFSNNSLPVFQDSHIGNRKVTITVQNPYDNSNTAQVQVDVVVKAKIVPVELKITGYKSSYLIGEYAALTDITGAVATLSDGTKLDLDDMKKLVDDKLATLKLTPATKITSSTKELTLSFTYKDATVTATCKIETVDPVCVLSGKTAVPYEKLEVALEDANDMSPTDVKKVTITLNDSVELTEKYQFNAERTIIIDLNGNDLTMSESQMFVPHKSAYKDVQIVIINSDSTDAKIIYDANDKNKQLVLGKNDELIIDWETEIAGIYEITLNVGENGKITGPQEVAFGNDAKYTITPDEGYEILEVFVDKKSKGKSTTVTLENVDADHEVAATFTKIVKVWENPFTDIYKSAPYYESIEFVYENELFKGVTTTKFEPNTTMTRAMFVTVLGRLAGIDEYDSRYAGKSSFSDVVSSAATDWYVPYVEWASSIGLLKGYEDGTFRPNREITHTEMYILMERYARNLLGINSGVSGTTIRATDTKDIPTWDGAYEAVQFAAKYEFLVLGTSNRITPNGNALRYELAMLLDSFCETFGILQETAAE